MSAATVVGASAIGADLGRIVGAANVEIRPTALVPYRTDATFGFSGIPQAVVRPGSTDEVSRILRWANQRGIPVVPAAQEPASPPGPAACMASSTATPAATFSASKPSSLMER
jgi:hypothetical protein